MRIRTSLARLYAPYGANMKFVGDNQPTAAKKRKRSTSLLPDVTFNLRKQVALHEAAHAVAARAYGVSVRFAEIVTSVAANIDARLGSVRHKKPDTAWANVVIALAGPAANIIFYPAERVLKGSSGDLEQAQRHAQQVDPQNSAEVERQAWTAALKIVRDNRTAIFCLAAVLEYAGNLSGAEIDAIISFDGKVRPGPSRRCQG
jgi:hypothetical protein